MFIVTGAESLWSIRHQLSGKKFVDLTHEFAPGIPHWLGFPNETRKTNYWYDKRPDTMGAGFFSEVFTHVGQWGMHVDPPTHFIKGLRTVDQIELLANLDQVPESGAIVVASFPKPQGGSGFPARMFAIVP